MNTVIIAILFLGIGSLILAGLSWLQRKFNINQYLAGLIGVVVLLAGMYFAAKAWF